MREDADHGHTFPAAIRHYRELKRARVDLEEARLRTKLAYSALA